MLKSLVKFKERIGPDGLIYTAITLLLMAWIPLIFIGFDPHHDGIILTNFNLLKFESSHQWPFNQYGPTWILIAKIFVGWVPFKSSIISLRILTLFYYLICTLLIYRITLKISTRRTGLMAIILFLSSQPFLGGLNSNFMAWPSALVMPCVLLITLFLNQSNTQLKFRSHLIMGSLITIVLFTRVQIGIATLVAVMVCLTLRRSFRNAGIVLLGAISTTLILFIFLSSWNWTKDSLTDQFLYSFIYVKGAFGSGNSYPFPIFTLIGSITVTFFWVTVSKFGSRAGRLTRKNYFSRIAFVVIVVLIVVCFLSATRKLSPIDSLQVFERRAWACIFIGSLFVAVLALIPSFQQRTGLLESIGSGSLVPLVALSTAGQIQSWPLFDQMHNWWGSVPGIIIVSILIRETQILPRLRNLLNVNANIALISLLVLVLIPFGSQLFQTKSYEKIEFLQNIYLPKNTHDAILGTQRYFDENIVTGAKVMNLCGDSDPFFTTHYFSSNRFYVFGYGQLGVAQMKKEIYESDVDFIVTCNALRFSELSNVSEDKAVRQVIRIHFRNPKKLSSYTDALNRTWSVWINSKK